MELYLQFGYGMMDHCRSLLSEWGGGTAILSPRDLKDGQLRRLASDLTAIENGRVLLDPQFYLPYADHERLRSHDFWPKDYESGVFWQGPALARLIEQLADLNNTLQTTAFVLPGMLAPRVDEDWLTAQEMILEEGITAKSPEDIIVTIALSADALKDESQIATLIERAERWSAGGFYLVVEHPGGKFLVDEPNWLANVLDLAAALRLKGSRVILGYCNQQMLIAACAKVNAIASGTWMNVRSFPPDKFRTAYEDEIKQRSIWYYCPQALSEYKIPFLDVAHRLGLLSLMQPSADYPTTPANILFGGLQPSSVGFTEQAAFRHFLSCLRVQCSASIKETFADTVAHHERLLDEAEVLLATLAASGIRGQLRDFSEALDVNRAALAVFRSTRGVMLSRKWATISQ